MLGETSREVKFSASGRGQFLETVETQFRAESSRKAVIIDLRLEISARRNDKIVAFAHQNGFQFQNVHSAASADGESKTESVFQRTCADKLIIKIHFDFLIHKQPNSDEIYSQTRLRRKLRLCRSEILLRLWRKIWLLEIWLRKILFARRKRAEVSAQHGRRQIVRRNLRQFRTASAAKSHISFV